METQLIGRGILFGLSALFGSAALLTLVVAYRVGDFAAWRRLAVFAGVHAFISAVLGKPGVRLSPEIQGNRVPF